MVEQGDIFIVKRIGVPRTGRFDNSSCEHPEEMCGVYFPAIKSPRALQTPPERTGHSTYLKHQDKKAHA